MQTETIPEFAARWKIGRSTAYLLAARGQIPGVVRLGRSVRVLVEVADAWMRRQAEQAVRDGGA